MRSPSIRTMGSGRTTLFDMPERHFEIDPESVPRNGLFRSRGLDMFTNAMDHNISQLARAVKERSFPGAVVCDVGCWDGERFLEYAPPDAELIGLERNDEAVEVARRNGIGALPANIEEHWPLDDNRSTWSFPIRSSNTLQILTISRLRPFEYYVQVEQLASRRRISRVGTTLL